MWDAWAECRSEFEKNRLVCSEAFAKRFSEIHQSLSEIELDAFVPPDEAVEVAACFRNAHSDLLSIAVGELGLRLKDKGAAKNQALLQRLWRRTNAA